MMSRRLSQLAFVVGLSSALIAPQARAVDDPQSRELSSHDEVPEVPREPCTNRRECGEHVLTGAYLGMDLGYSFAHEKEARIGGVERPIPLYFRIGVELWRHWMLSVGYGALFFRDEAPIQRELVSCDRYTQECGDPYKEKSNVFGDFMIFETDVHHDFKLTKNLALMPGVHLGYLQTMFPITREVTCEDCPKGKPIDFDTSGPYTGGSLQLNVGSVAAVGVRAMWHFQSDLYQTSTLYFGIFGG